MFFAYQEFTAKFSNYMNPQSLDFCDIFEKIKPTRKGFMD